jgi:hypothetical protein
VTGSFEPNTGQSSVKPEGELCAKSGRSGGSIKLVLTLLFATIADSRVITSMSAGATNLTLAMSFFIISCLNGGQF